MKKKLMDILACPIDKYYPLELHVFEEKEEIVEGVIICPKCLRWYPIRDEIPEMLPDESTKGEGRVAFSAKMERKIPSEDSFRGQAIQPRGKKEIERPGIMHWQIKIVARI